MMLFSLPNHGLNNQGHFEYLHLINPFHQALGLYHYHLRHILFVYLQDVLIQGHCNKLLE